MTETPRPRPAPTAAGRCLCGGVSYEVRGPLRPVLNCHCRRCRRWTGHFMAATNCRQTDLRLLSDESLSWHHPTDDPNVAYGFCSDCGGSLFWKVREGPDDQADHVSICAGTLDLPTGLTTQGALFTPEAADYHTLDPNVEARHQE
ncbi:MAG: GFA family protein [Acidimicrobiaceae bacterium]|nr:GFA family protein [Acidimicrobiaceae bacterium]MCY4279820.1 GFA family protein [Acidimicrobiaceae bacterium]MCY4293774.1 GFA family protein [Acidimicrobiaceae bacterium]